MAYDGREQLREAAVALARRLSPRLGDALASRPELLNQLIDAITRAIKSEVQTAVAALPRPSQGQPSALAGRVEERIDEDKVAAAVADLMAAKLVAWFEKDGQVRDAFGAAVAREFMQHLDLEEFAHEVADQVSDRLARQVTVQVSDG